MAGAMDAVAAITQIRDTIVTLHQRISVIQGNVADLSRRLDTHENIHDPIIPVVEAMRNQMSALGPQVADIIASDTNQEAKVNAVDTRVTTVTTEMRDSGLDSGTSSRITNMESQAVGGC